MRKAKLLLIISVLCVCLALCVACKKTDDTPSPSVTTDSAEETTNVTNDETTQTSTSEDESSEQTTEMITDKNDDEIVVAKKLEKEFDKTITLISDEKVTTKSGLTYTASGYSEIKDNKFDIGSGTLTVDLNGIFTDMYNKFILCYEATAPMKGSVTYLTSNGSYVTDEFFLEEGAHTFSCLNTGYLDGKYGINLECMTFTSLVGSGSIGLYELETEKCKIFSSAVYYIENSSYKVGIKLTWGGGISYIQDKVNTSYDLFNLINQHDTGRLIQQSYYGTSGDSQYTPGDYNGASWPYNPVQGGNLVQDHSRIIDIVIEDESIYIKSQPQDWGQLNSLTPSYMENSYTVYSDRITVDNRFVDFSYYNNPYREQELPAFYTVSYLNSFVYYDGFESWTDGDLSYNTNLPFWGSDLDSERAMCQFPIRQSNKETWCAWVNQDIDYGIGLYVPNVDYFLAGSFSYDGSKDAGDDSTNYVAPLNSLKIVSGEAIEYSYIICTGSVNQIRNTFKEHKDFATNESLHNNYISKRIPDQMASGLTYDFTYASSIGTIQATNNATASFSETENALMLTVNGIDVQTVLQFNNIDFSPKAEDYSKVTIKYKVPAGTSIAANMFEMFLCAGDTLTPAAGKSINANYICDGEYHEITVDLSTLSFWSGTINHIRFDFYGNSTVGDVLYIKSIEFHN